VYPRSLIVLCALLSACSPQIRLLKEPGADRVADYHWTAAAPDGLNVTVHTVLVRDSPGSWVRDADWDEYILTIKNSSSSGLQIERVQLYSQYLSAAQDSSLSRQQLEDRSRATLANVRDAAVVAGAGAVVVGTTMAVASAGYVGAIAALPVGFIAIPLVIGYESEHTAIRRNRERQDNSLIQLTMLERGIHLPLDIPPGTEATRSAFFPLTPAPSRLLVGYRIDDEPHLLALELPALAQLHIKPGTTPREEPKDLAGTAQIQSVPAPGTASSNAAR
jgi:hypothetical protein